MGNQRYLDHPPSSAKIDDNFYQVAISVVALWGT
jgi:hypothetical protein